MSTKIIMENNSIGGRANVLNGARIQSSDIEVCVRNSFIDECAHVLENIDITDVRKTIEEEVNKMDKSSPEYPHIQELLRQNASNESSLVKSILQHLARFSEGVVASIVASMLLR